MAETRKTNGRKTDGTFAAGNSLGGRTPGSRHKITLAVEALLEGQHAALTQKADCQWNKVVFGRLPGPVRAPEKLRLDLYADLRLRAREEGLPMIDEDLAL